jgi:hypothetical protein
MFDCTEWEERWEDPVCARQTIEGLKAVLDYDEHGFFFFPYESKVIFLTALPGPTRDGYALIRTDPSKKGMYETTLKKAFKHPRDHWMMMNESDFLSFANFLMVTARKDQRRDTFASGNVLGSASREWWRHKGRELPPEERPVPTPNVDPSAGFGPIGESFTWEQGRAFFSDPLSVGIAGREPRIKEEAWVHAAAGFIRRDGTEQWLVNMLHSLRANLDRH